MTPGFRFLVLTAAAAVGFLWHSSVLAATYYVSTGGNDANSGSLSAPWRTIQKAANVMVAGDTVYVRGGTYSSDGTCGPPNTSVCAIKPQNSGTPGNPIAYRAYPGERPRITAAYIYIFQKNYLIIDGFDLDGRNIVTTDAGSGDDVLGIVIENNRIYNLSFSAGSNGAAINIHDCNGCLIRNNYLHDIRVGGTTNDQNSSGIQSFDMTNTIIEHNEVWNAGNGVFHKRSKSNAIKGATIRYNRFHDLDYYCIRYSVAGAGDPGHNGQEVYGNICEGVRYYGVYGNTTEAGTESSGLKIYNNVFRTGDRAILIQRWKDIEVWNNIFYDLPKVLNTGQTISKWNYNLCFPSCVFEYQGTTYTSLDAWRAGTGFDMQGLRSDPQFVDLAYRLSATSPAVDAGRTNGLSTGAVVDMGARPFGTEIVGPAAGPAPMPPLNVTVR